MWNNNVKASIPPTKDYLVPLFFLGLAAVGAFCLGYSVVG